MGMRLLFYFMKSLHKSLRYIWILALGGLGLYSVFVTPSIDRYWTVFIFFGLVFVTLLAFFSNVVRILWGGRRVVLRFGAALLAAACLTYLLALMSLRQLRLLDFLSVCMIGAAGSWFLLSKKNL